MNRFIAGDRAPSSPKRSEMLPCAHPALDRPMILFQDVIEILRGAALATVGQIACGLECGNVGWISGVLVGIDDPWRGMILPAQGFGQKALSRCCIAFGQRRKSIVAPLESTARYKYTHLPLTRT